MMSRTAYAVCLCTVLLAAGASGGLLQNASFEQDFGAREDMNMWGDYGDAFGQAYQVVAGQGGYAKKAYGGERMLVVNVLPASWNGAWQQIPMDAGKPYAFTGRYLIKGGDLPANCVTFLKIEFYDESDQVIEAVEGHNLRVDTQGQWVETAMRGQTPAGTRSVRFVVIAGDNAGNEALVDRIFWDDVDVTD